MLNQGQAMAIENSTSNNLQQWLNKWLPQVSQSDKSNVGAASGDVADTSTDAVTVSLSSRAEKLSRIHQEFFAGGPISSDKIRDLSVRMYEEGLLDADDVSRLTGEAPPRSGMVKEAISFLSDFISQESIDGDSEGARELNKALQVLTQIDKPITAERLSQEKDSAAYIAQYRDLLQETDADSALIEGFDQLQNVFQALSQVRAQDVNSAAASYTALYDQLNKN
jgi:hypothetical protein